eukprot:5969992-Pleurochrysis_carterae.AAC.1
MDSEYKAACNAMQEAVKRELQAEFARVDKQDQDRFATTFSALSFAAPHSLPLPYHENSKTDVSDITALLALFGHKQSRELVALEPLSIVTPAHTFYTYLLPA